ncbi:hypothetical protein QFC21_005880 [Naganishia friedmannii]|uniref:Uncharacterized protein n=1 Tax=Naganishia friedmannii TaxID=89922 RepID=A0ACC2V733_9TREE|nr:hypothetical protein QFC21_005880 [Naganishia friedmannii]
MQEVRVGLATTVEDCLAVGEISYHVNDDLHWYHAINAAVNPLDLQERMSAIASNVLHRHHGLVVVARAQERIIGYILAWEQAQGGPEDPYEQPNVKTEIPGRNMTNWQSLCDEIDSVCDRVDAERGSLLCKLSIMQTFPLIVLKRDCQHAIDVDEVAILPEYQKRGIGRKLVEFVVQSARDFNLATIVLTSVPEAVPSYEEKLRFERLGVPIYFGVDEKSELVPMWMRLT